MDKFKSTVASVMLVAGLLFGFHVSAQNAKTFQVAGWNSENSLPEWWSESTYLPERMEGALHLRMGSSRNFGGSPAIGRPNCDMSMLYSAKSNVPISPSEMEYCALLEFDLFKHVNSDRRNMNNSFVRQDTITEFTDVINNRIELFRQNDFYYLRASDVQFSSFDLSQSAMEIRANWTQSYIPMSSKAGRAAVITYKFDEPNFRKENNRYWSIRLMDDENGGRDLETARVNNRFITALNFFTFDVIGVREVNEQSGISRYINVQVRHFSIPYMKQGGWTVTTGIGG